MLALHSSNSLSLLFVLTVSFLPDGIHSSFSKSCHNDECSDKTIQCHQTQDCLIQCIDDNSCQNLTINCPYAPNAFCEIDCIGSNSCINLTIYCPPGSADNSTENCIVQGNDKVSGLTIYAIDGWKQIEIDDVSTDNNLGTLYCGPSLQSSCNIAMISDEYTCSLSDHPCNVPDIVTTDSGEGVEEETDVMFSWDFTLWHIIIGSIIIVIVIACCQFMILLVYKVCRSSDDDETEETEEIPKQIPPSSPKAFEMQQQQQQNHLNTYTGNGSQREMSVSRSVASMQITHSSQLPIVSRPRMSIHKSAPMIAGMPSQYQYSPQNSPRSHQPPQRRRKPRSRTFDLPASYDANHNRSYLASQRHSIANYPSSAIVQSSPLQLAGDRVRRGSASSGSQYMGNNLGILGGTSSLRGGPIRTIDEHKRSEYSENNNQQDLEITDINNIKNNSSDVHQISDDDIKSQLPVSPSPAPGDGNALKVSNPYLMAATTPSTPLQHHPQSDSEELFNNGPGAINRTPGGTPNGSP